MEFLTSELYKFIVDVVYVLVSLGGLALTIIIATQTYHLQKTVTRVTVLTYNREVLDSIRPILTQYRSEVREGWMNLFKENKRNPDAQYKGLIDKHISDVLLMNSNYNENSHKIPRQLRNDLNTRMWVTYGELLQIDKRGNNIDFKVSLAAQSLDQFIIFIDEMNSEYRTEDVSSLLD
ncbi:MAG: hypothetical protein EP346_01505 [Bacteroidetes bacterium]|nr:MAG: hypothetical protein EP346_01505 [Bacteroidota bacterium]